MFIYILNLSLEKEPLAALMLLLCVAHGDDGGICHYNFRTGQIRAVAYIATCV